MLRARWLPIPILFAALVSTLIAALRWAQAGPASYDPETKSFRLTYTYATLPFPTMDHDQIAAIGKPDSPTEEQDAKVRAIVKQVSDAIYEATRGRAKIGMLDNTDTVKNADIIISLTGDPLGRGGVSTLGTIEGRPGQLILYYERLSKEWEQDIVLTAAHELCHYLFALPDEYDGPSGRCPEQNPAGPGCLMDNYLSNGSRHGWYGRLCQNDHDPNAPNLATVIAGQSQTQSCEDLVDKFFKKYDVDPKKPLTKQSLTELDTSTEVAPPLSAAGATAGNTVPIPFSGVFKRLIDATASRVRVEAENMNKEAKGAGSRTTVAFRDTERSKLRALAEKFLNDQIVANRASADFIAPTAEQLKSALDLAIEKGTNLPVGKPATFTDILVRTLKGAARDLARQKAGTGTTPVAGLVATTLDSKALDAIKKFVLAQLRLIAFPKLSRPTTVTSASAPGAFSPEEERFLESLATEAAQKVQGTSDFTRYFNAALQHIRLSQEIASTVTAVAEEVGAPGTESRTTFLKKINLDLEKLALPGQPFTGFGRRRTIIFNPYPLYPEYDNLRLQAGDSISYTGIRDLVAGQFLRLLKRERIEILDELESPAEFGGGPAGGSVNRGPDDRFKTHTKLFNQLAEMVRRNRVENIIILVPPGGFSPKLGQPLEDLRRRIIDDSDVRLDLVLMNGARVSDRIRDLAVRSGGTTQIWIDADETGAIIQRIESESSSGSWVITPQQAALELKGDSQPKPGGAVKEDVLRGLKLKTIQEEFDRNVDATATDIFQYQDLLKKYVMLQQGFAKQDIYAVEVKPFIARTRDLGDAFLEVQEALKKLDEAHFSATSTDEVSRAIIKVNNRLRQVYLKEMEAYARDRGDELSPLKTTHDFLAAVLGDQLRAIAARNIRDSAQYLDSTPPAPLPEWQLKESQFWNLLRARAIASEMNYVTTFQTTDQVAKFFTDREAFANVLDRVLSWQGLKFSADLKSEDRAELPKNLEPTADEAQPLTPGEVRFFRVLQMIERLAAPAPAPRPPARSGAASGLDVVEVEEPWRLSNMSNAIWACLHADIWNALKNKNFFSAEKNRIMASPTLSIAEKQSRYAALFEAARTLDVIHYATPASSVEGNLFLLARKSAPSDPARQGEGSVWGESRVETALAWAPSRYRPVFSDYTPIAPRFAPPPRLSENVQRLESVKAQRAPQAAAYYAPTLGAPPALPLAAVGAVAGLPGATPLAAPPVPAVSLSTTDLQLAMVQRRLDGLTSLVQQEIGFQSPSQFEDTLARIKQALDESNERSILLGMKLLSRIRLLEDNLRALERNQDTDKPSHPNRQRLPITDRLERYRSGSKENFRSEEDDKPKLTYEGDEYAITFKPFTAEHEADLELVVGFSRPLVSFEELKKLPSQLTLLKDFGEDASRPVSRNFNADYLQLDAESSTDLMLVFRVPNPRLTAGYLPKGTYTPRLTIARKYLPVTNRIDPRVNVTFSIATARPNVQLIAKLRQDSPYENSQDPRLKKEVAFHGTIPSELFDAVVEVQTLAGSPLQDVDVKGDYLKIDENGVSDLRSYHIVFNDKGNDGDVRPGDGIYAGKITLDQKRQSGVEYRLFIEAKNKAGTKFLPVSETFAKPGEETKAKELPAVDPFQRATSLNFRARLNDSTSR